MTTSPNYGFNLPGSSDSAAIGPITDNFSAIDTILKGVSDNADAAARVVFSETAPHTGTDGNLGTEGIPGEIMVHYWIDESTGVEEYALYLCLGKRYDNMIGYDRYVWLRIPHGGIA